MAKLRDELEREYELYELNRKHLTILMVRLLFCLYAEDATLFQPNQFRNLLADKRPDQETGEFCETLERLFEVLDTPEDSRKKSIAGRYTAFPYVNGGLFSGEIDMPYFSEKSKRILLDECCPFQWSAISPALFGQLFQSVLSKEEQRNGGMLYTTAENIRKVTKPLFLDALELKLRKIGNQKAKLLELQEELASIKLLDPACGSGNFLTQSYIDLRRLENKILERLIDPGSTGQGALQVDDVFSSRVPIGNFFGIEIDDFAVHVAETAMQIAKHQMDVETSIVLNRSISTLPLTKDTSIIQANALDYDWNELLPAADCSYILGNPPYLGAKQQSPQQKSEVIAALKGAKNSGSVDYAAAWFHRAADYMADHSIRCAFVATSSICQGEQVASIWKPLWDSGVRIDFAHNAFTWKNEAKEQAHVSVVIVGFSRLGGTKSLFYHENQAVDAVEKWPSNINAYLKDERDIFIWSRKKPLCTVPCIGLGNKLVANGNYEFTPEELETFLAEEPAAAPYFHPFMGSEQFINGTKRYVLWLGDATPAQLEDLPKCRERVVAVRDFRLASTSKSTRKLAEKPTHYHVEKMPESTSIIVPRVSSERRRYVPLGFIDPDTFCSDGAMIVPNGTFYHFGVLHSRMHNIWMRAVSGRLEGRFRYSGGVVYNNFPWPQANSSNVGTPVEDLVSDTIRQRIESDARSVLSARKEYFRDGFTIADMYNPDKDFMFENLVNAHKALDEEVERAYGLNPGLSEFEILDCLFELYTELAR